MREISFRFRLTSFLVLLSFVCEPAAFAAPEISALAAIPAKPAVPNFSDATALVEERIAGDKNRALYLIQTAHTNDSAQKNIAEIAQSLYESQKVSTIYVEGGMGDMSLSFLRGKASPAKRQSVAKSLLLQGELNGPEYLDLASDLPLRLYGVEDRELYLNSIRAYARVAKDRDELKPILDKLQRASDLVKASVYNPSLLSFDTLRQDHFSGKVSLADYFAKLSSTAERSGVSLQYYPELKKLSQITALEKAVDFQKAQQEQQLAMASLSADEQKELLEGGAPSAGTPDIKRLHAIISYLANATQNFKAYPELAKYKRYLDILRAMDSSQALSELDVLEHELFRKLSRSAQEEELFRADEAVRRIGKLMTLTMTPQEYSDYRQYVKKHSLAELAGYLNRLIAESDQNYDKIIFWDKRLEDFTRDAETFYELTFERDQKFIEAVRKDMAENKIQKAALMIGGYHAPNLKHLLGEQGIAYASILPQMTKETNLKRYEKILLERSQVVEKLAAQTDNQMEQLGARLAILPKIEARLNEGGPGIGVGGQGTQGGWQIPFFGARLSRNGWESDEDASVSWRDMSAAQRQDAQRRWREMGQAGREDATRRWRDASQNERDRRGNVRNQPKSNGARLTTQKPFSAEEFASNLRSSSWLARHADGDIRRDVYPGITALTSEQRGQVEKVLRKALQTAEGYDRTEINYSLSDLEYAPKRADSAKAGARMATRTVSLVLGGSRIEVPGVSNVEISENQLEAVLTNPNGKKLKISAYQHQGDTILKIGNSSYLGNTNILDVAKINPIGNPDWFEFMNISPSDERNLALYDFPLPLEWNTGVPSVFPANRTLHPAYMPEPVSQATLTDYRRRMSLLVGDKPLSEWKEADLDRVLFNFPEILHKITVLALSGTYKDYHDAQALISYLTQLRQKAQTGQTDIPKEQLRLVVQRYYLLTHLSDFLLLAYTGVDWNKWKALQGEIRSAKKSEEAASQMVANRALTIFEEEPTRAKLPVDNPSDWRVTHIEPIVDGSPEAPYLGTESDEASSRTGLVYRFGKVAIETATMVNLIFAGGSATTVKKIMKKNKLVHDALKVVTLQGIMWINILQARIGSLLGQNDKARLILATSVGGADEGESDSSTRRFLNEEYPSEVNSSQIKVVVQRNGLVLNPKNGNVQRFADERIAVAAENHLWAFLSLLLDRQEVVDIVSNTSGIVSMGNGDNILNFARAGMVGEILYGREVEGKKVATVAVMSPSAGDKKIGVASLVTYTNLKTGEKTTRKELVEISRFPTRSKKKTGYTGVDLEGQEDTAFYKEAEKNKWFVEDVLSDEAGNQKRVAANVAFYAIDLKLFIARIFGLNEDSPTFKEELARIGAQEWSDRILEIASKVPATKLPNKEVPSEDGSSKVTGYITEAMVQDFIVNSIGLLSVPGLKDPEVLVRMSPREDTFLPYKGTKQNELDEEGHEVIANGKPVENPYDLIANMRRYVGVIKSLLKKNHKFLLGKGNYVLEVIPVTLDEVREANKQKPAEENLFSQTSGARLAEANEAAQTIVKLAAKVPADELMTRIHGHQTHLLENPQYQARGARGVPPGGAFDPKIDEILKQIEAAQTKAETPVDTIPENYFSGASGQRRTYPKQAPTPAQPAFDPQPILDAAFNALAHPDQSVAGFLSQMGENAPAGTTVFLRDYSANARPDSLPLWVSPDEKHVFVQAPPDGPSYAMLKFSQAPQDGTPNDALKAAALKAWQDLSAAVLDRLQTQYPDRVVAVSVNLSKDLPEIYLDLYNRQAQNRESISYEAPVQPKGLEKTVEPLELFLKKLGTIYGASLESAEREVRAHLEYLDYVAQEAAHGFKAAQRGRESAGVTQALGVVSSAASTDPGRKKLLEDALSRIKGVRDAVSRFDGIFGLDGTASVWPTGSTVVIRDLRGPISGELREEWSKSLMNLEWLSGASGTQDLTIVLKNATVEEARLRAFYQERGLQIQRVVKEYLDKLGVFNQFEILNIVDRSLQIDPNDKRAFLYTPRHWEIVVGETPKQGARLSDVGSVAAPSMLWAEDNEIMVYGLNQPKYPSKNSALADGLETIFAEIHQVFTGNIKIDAVLVPQSAEELDQFLNLDKRKLKDGLIPIGTTVYRFSPEVLQTDDYPSRGVLSEFINSLEVRDFLKPQDVITVYPVRYYLPAGVAGNPKPDTRVALILVQKKIFKNKAAQSGARLSSLRVTSDRDSLIAFIKGMTSERRKDYTYRLHLDDQPVQIFSERQGSVPITHENVSIRLSGALKIGTSYQSEDAEIDDINKTISIKIYTVRKSAVEEDVISGTRLATPLQPPLAVGSPASELLKRLGQAEGVKVFYRANPIVYQVLGLGEDIRVYVDANKRGSEAKDTVITAGKVTFHAYYVSADHPLVAELRGRAGARMAGYFENYYDHYFTAINHLIAERETLRETKDYILINKEGQGPEVDAWKARVRKNTLGLQTMAGVINQDLHQTAQPRWEEAEKLAQRASELAVDDLSIIAGARLAYSDQFLIAYIGQDRGVQNELRVVRRLWTRYKELQTTQEREVKIPSDVQGHAMLQAQSLYGQIEEEAAQARAKLAAKILRAIGAISIQGWTPRQVETLLLKPAFSSEPFNAPEAGWLYDVADQMFKGARLTAVPAIGASWWEQKRLNFWIPLAEGLGRDMSRERSFAVSQAHNDGAGVAIHSAFQTVRAFKEITDASWLQVLRLSFYAQQAKIAGLDPQQPLRLAVSETTRPGTSSVEIAIGLLKDMVGKQSAEKAGARLQASLVEPLANRLHEVNVAFIGARMAVTDYSTFKYTDNAGAKHQTTIGLRVHLPEPDLGGSAYAEPGFAVQYQLKPGDAWSLLGYIVKAQTEAEILAALKASLEGDRTTKRYTNAEERIKDAYATVSLAFGGRLAQMTPSVALDLLHEQIGQMGALPLSVGQYTNGRTLSLNSGGYHVDLAANPSGKWSIALSDRNGRTVYGVSFDALTGRISVNSGNASWLPLWDADKNQPKIFQDPLFAFQLRRGLDNKWNVTVLLDRAVYDRLIRDIPIMDSPLAIQLAAPAGARMAEGSEALVLTTALNNFTEPLSYRVIVQIDNHETTINLMTEDQALPIATHTFTWQPTGDPDQAAQRLAEAIAASMRESGKRPGNLLPAGLFDEAVYMHVDKPAGARLTADDRISHVTSSLGLVLSYFQQGDSENAGRALVSLSGSVRELTPEDAAALPFLLDATRTRNLPVGITLEAIQKIGSSAAPAVRAELKREDVGIFGAYYREALSAITGARMAGYYDSYFDTFNTLSVARENLRRTKDYTFINGEGQGADVETWKANLRANSQVLRDLAVSIYFDLSSHAYEGHEAAEQLAERANNLAGDELERFSGARMAEREDLNPQLLIRLLNDPRTVVFSTKGDFAREKLGDDQRSKEDELAFSWNGYVYLLQYHFVRRDQGQEETLSNHAIFAHRSEVNRYLKLPSTNVQQFIDQALLDGRMTIFDHKTEGFGDLLAAANTRISGQAAGARLTSQTTRREAEGARTAPLASLMVKAPENTAPSLVSLGLNEIDLRRIGARLALAVGGASRLDGVTMPYTVLEPAMVQFQATGPNSLILSVSGFNIDIQDVREQANALAASETRGGTSVQAKNAGRELLTLNQASILGVQAQLSEIEGGPKALEIPLSFLKFDGPFDAAAYDAQVRLFFSAAIDVKNSVAGKTIDAVYFSGIDNYFDRSNPDEARMALMIRAHFEEMSAQYPFLRLAAPDPKQIDGPIARAVNADTEENSSQDGQSIYLAASGARLSTFNGWGSYLRTLVAAAALFVPSYVKGQGIDFSKPVVGSSGFEQVYGVVSSHATQDSKLSKEGLASAFQGNREFLYGIRWNLPLAAAIVDAMTAAAQMMEKVVGSSA